MIKTNNEHNVYCDESCHLEKDKQPVMLLGAIWCPKIEAKRHASALREIKERNYSRGELKWTKVSASRNSFFIEILEYFFLMDGLKFRCLIIDNKRYLDYSYYNLGSHDSFYYKIYFYLLRNILSPINKYNIYLDIKDTRSQRKINILGDVLCNSFHDFERKIINRIQHVRSKEVELLQLTDFLIGAISYSSRRLSSSRSKLAIVSRIKELSGLNLKHTTPPWEEKFNLFFFSPRRDTHE